MTYKEFYNAIITGELRIKTGKTKDAETIISKAFEVVDNNIVINSALVEFAKSAIVKLDNKNNSKSSSKLTAAQVENIDLANTIFTSMESDKVYTSKMLSEDFCISVQKATSIAKKIVELYPDSFIIGETRANGRLIKSYAKISK